MIKRKGITKIAIDSPAAAGAGTVAKEISKHFNLLYLDTGKIYRFIAKLKLENPKKFNLKFIKKKISFLNLKNLSNKNLIRDNIGLEASKIAKKKSIRKIVLNYQLNSAYNPPKRYKGSCLDGRDITYNIIPDAEFKFFITADVKTRAMRRFKELKTINNKLSFNEVLKSIKIRDKSDYKRKVAPLKKTEDSVLINTTKLTKRQSFLKIKKIIDKKLKN